MLATYKFKFKFKFDLLVGSCHCSYQCPHLSAHRSETPANTRSSLFRDVYPAVVIVFGVLGRVASESPGLADKRHNVTRRITVVTQSLFKLLCSAVPALVLNKLHTWRAAIPLDNYIQQLGRPGAVQLVPR